MSRELSKWIKVGGWHDESLKDINDNPIPQGGKEVC